MSSTGLAVFDTTVQDTNRWLALLLQKIGGDDKHRAYLILRAALHTLRDRMEINSVAHFSAQLPILLRGIFYEGWNPARTPSKERHAAEFLDHFRSHLPAGLSINADHAIRCAFAVIWEMIDPREVEKIIKRLPEDLRELWVAH